MTIKLKQLNFTNRQKVPVLLQSEISECGLTCLAMVASFHGHETDLNYMRRNYGLSTKGATLASLMDVAAKMNLQSRPLRLDLEHLPELKTPCILHWDMTHFVVLTKVESDGIHINDPAKGAAFIPTAEVNSRFTGIALELTPNAEFKRENTKEELKFSQLWTSSKGIKSALIGIFIASIVLQVALIIAPLYMQTVVDSVVGSNDKVTLLALAIGFGLLMLIQVGVTLIRSNIVIYSSNQLSEQISTLLLRKVFRLPTSFFESRHIGDISARFQSINQIKDIFTTGLVEAVIDGLLVIATLVMMAIYSVKLSLIVCAALVIYFIARVAMHSSMKDATEKQLVSTGLRDSSFIESIRAIQAVKLYGKEDHRVTHWQNNNVDTLNAGIRTSRLTMLYTAVNQFVFGLENIIIVYLGASLIMAGEMSVGMLFAFNSYKLQFSQKSSALVDKYLQYKMAKVHLQRLADFVLTDGEQNTHTAGLSHSIDGSMSIKNLGFRYSDSEPYIFKGVNLDVKAGESVAIIGPSGCGKTTLMKVLLGLIKPTEGQWLAGNLDPNGQYANDYRQQIAAVMQDDTLLSGSIADNIAFFDDAVDINAIESAAKLAAIHEDIIRMPMGYNTLVGEMGGSISGGQRQRILLARALYRQPKILFLDEATSALDVQMEANVNSSVRGLSITRIIIAHRPETIRSADRVVVMNGGQLQELNKQILEPAKAA